jgi:hypothetical protein
LFIGIVAGFAVTVLLSVALRRLQLKLFSPRRITVSP